LPQSPRGPRGRAVSHVLRSAGMITIARSPSARRGADILSQYSGQTVLAVGAHPDDLELGVGGTLARLSATGARVVMAVLSIPNNLAARRIEARRAAATLGCEVRLLTPDRCTRVED